jgi:hypothetical protein
MKRTLDVVGDHIDEAIVNLDSAYSIAKKTFSYGTPLRTMLSDAVISVHEARRELEKVNG